MIRRLFLILVILVVVGFGGFTAFAWHSALPARNTAEPLQFAPDQVARGEVLAKAGYCATCHTGPSGKENAGGFAMNTAFGTIYTTNITPDLRTGIGTWSEAAFKRAMQRGIAADGSHLLPAFPYTNFTLLSDQDVADLYAYIMTRPAVEATTPPNTVPFPLNIRLFQAGWKLLFFHEGRYKPDPAQNAEWNRGRYLADGIAHCNACHTPRNALGGLQASAPLAGADVDGWSAPPLNGHNQTPIPWGVEELTAYLGKGVSLYHGSAAGPMAPVVLGLQALSPADLHALAVYIGSQAAPQGMPADTANRVSSVLSQTVKRSAGLEGTSGARLYEGACAACHANSGTLVLDRPELALNSALSLPEPTNLIRVILGGINARDGIPGVVMPAFAPALSDTDIADLVTYLRRTRTDLPPWQDVPAKIAALRHEMAPPSPSSKEARP